MHLYKNKGKKSVCDNHRGISLLCIAGKILAGVTLNHIHIHVANSIYPESQCGFRAGRDTVDMILVLRQAQEKIYEQNIDLYVVFADLTKSFDTVNWEAL